MAIYSSTLIIKGNLNVSDADLLQLLELDKPESLVDAHVVGRENISYDEALASLSSRGDEVFVSSFGEFTVIVSFALISDYAATRGLLKKSVARLFPEQEYFLFFTESVSMLCGFIYGIGNQIIRKKYVQNSKYAKVYDHDMDIGALLPEEKEIFNNLVDYVDDYPIKSKSYMGGVHDFNIALSFLEREFKVVVGSPSFANLVLNKNIEKELPRAYIDRVLDRLEEREIEPLMFEVIKPLMKELKLKKIDFKEPSMYQKYKGYYRQFDINKRVVVRVSVSSFHSYMGVSMDCYVKFHDEHYNQFIEDAVFTNGLGIPFFSLSSSNELLKLRKNENVSLQRKSDLNYFASRVTEELSSIKSLINKLSVTNDVSTFFNDEDLFNYSFRELKEICSFRNRLEKSSYLNVCMLYYSLHPSTELASSILNTVDYQCQTESLARYHNEVVSKVKEILARKLDAAKV